jgi:RND superfamily putative drug exporter
MTDPGDRVHGRLARLHRLSSLPSGRRTKWLVALIWVAVAVVAGLAATKFHGAENNDPSSYLPGSAESSRALAEVRRITGGNALTPAVVVFFHAGGLHAPDRRLIAAARQTLNSQLPRDGVPAGVPVPSRDGEAALLVFGLRLHNSQRLLDATVQRIKHVVRDRALRGLEVAVSGPAGSSYDAEQVFSKVDGTLLLVTVGLIFVLLLVIYRSPIFWVIPLLAVALAEVCSEAFGYVLTLAGVTVNAEAAGILTVLVFGAGTDYALLLVSRYREELRHHPDHHDAMRAALRRAGPVLAASAGTVILALCCLLAARVNGTQGLGPVAGCGVALALISSLTLLPTLLVICGRRIFWPFVPYCSDEPAAKPGAGRWTAVANRVNRSHRLIALIATAGLAVLCLGVLSLNTGLTSGNSFRGSVESATGQHIIAAHYPAGMSEPAQVVVPDGRPATRVRAAVARLPGVAAVGPLQHGAVSAFFTATLTANPSSTSAFDMIAPLRAAARTAGGRDTLVGGPTAQEVDQRGAATRDTKLIVPMILLVVFAILGMILRSLVAPVLLIATVVLSFGAALGTGAFLFAHAFGYPGEDPSLVLFAFLFLVALGVDYNIFLMARVREETHRVGTRHAVNRGLVLTGPVITSAGIVLAGTFAALASLPLIGFTELGFVIAFGVLLDTLLVRTILVPALVIELDLRVWWPSNLARADGPDGRGFAAGRMPPPLLDRT